MWDILISKDVRQGKKRGWPLKYETQDNTPLMGDIAKKKAVIQQIKSRKRKEQNVLAFSVKKISHVYTKGGGAKGKI